jgi:DNA-binding transcriptional LysR family regulator
VFRGNSVHAVRDAAAAGLGVAVLPHFFARREPRFRLLADDVLGSRTLTLVVHPALTQVARVRAVIDFLVEVITRDRDRGVFG